MGRKADELAGKLQQIGLLPTEASIYLALLERGPLGAQTLADIVGVTRTTAYSSLRSLVDKGLAETGPSYGSKFLAVLPKQALPSLIDHERQALTEAIHTKETIAKELVSELPDAAEAEGSIEDVVEVIRHPRSIGARVDRLQAEAKSQIDVLVKAPLITKPGEDPGALAALARGVTIRTLYEEAVLADEDVAPFLEGWIAAGEEARIFDGELPMKGAVFDNTRALLPLETPTEVRPITVIVLNHPALAAGLSVMFESLWQRSRPL